MNERVKILWAKAAESNFGDSWEEQTAFMSKFAELIVRECAGICHKMAEDSDSYVVHDGDTCAEQIKKHFGVEE
jgi:hypothetical protein